MTRDYNVKVVWINPLIFQKILCCLFRAIYILVCWGISRGIAHTDFELEMAVIFVENIKSFVFIYLLLLGGGAIEQYNPNLNFRVPTKPLSETERHYTLHCPIL